MTRSQGPIDFCNILELISFLNVCVFTVESPPEDLPEETIIIVGCVCGSIVLILLVVLIVLCCRRHQAKSESNIILFYLFLYLQSG